jgi:hypothetical protein
MRQASTPLACAKFAKAIRYIPIDFAKNLRAHIAAMRRGDFCPHPLASKKKELHALLTLSQRAEQINIKQTTQRKTI